MADELRDPQAERRERRAYERWREEQQAAGMAPKRNVRSRPKTLRTPAPPPVPELPLHVAETRDAVPAAKRLALRAARERGKRRPKSAVQWPDGHA